MLKTTALVVPNFGSVTFLLSISNTQDKYRFAKSHLCSKPALMIG